jgi:hypothetical protein
MKDKSIALWTSVGFSYFSLGYEKKSKNQENRKKIIEKTEP